METLEQTISRLESDLQTEVARQPQTQDEMDVKNQRINSLSEEIHKLKEQLSQLAAREQKFVAHVDSLQQQIQDMDLLGAILPESQLQETNISLTEWNDMRQSLNQILHAWATDIQQATHTAHNVEVDKLQAELRENKAQNAGHQEQLLQAQRQNEVLQQKMAAVTSDNQDLKESVKVESAAHAHTVRLLNETKTRLNEAEAKIEDMQRQLAEANKPKASTQPSQSVQEQLEGLRKKSAESWAEKANRGLARFNLPLLQTPELPTLPAQEDNPNGNTFPAVGSESNRIPAPEVAENVGNSFREDTVSTGQREMDGDGSAQEAMERATEERIADLEARVTALEVRKAVA